MIREIEAEVQYTRLEIGKGALDKHVMDAMRKVPRHKFVPDDLQAFAYDNRPLPIGDGQTISQPYIVALMTDLLDLGENDIVLEVGTGSGYQTAILSKLAKRVYTVEIVEHLGIQTAQRLQQLGYKNVDTRIGNGYHGWPEHAPFDAIIVTAAAPHIPPPLLDQLKPGGKMVIPIGSPFSTQELVLVDKNASGKVETRNVLPVAFVPLTGEPHKG